MKKLYILLIILMLLVFTSCEEQNNVYEDETVTTTDYEYTTEFKLSSGLVYITESGEKYHTYYCKYITNRNYTEIDIDTAISIGYTPCSVCDPDFYN